MPIDEQGQHSGGRTWRLPVSARALAEIAAVAITIYGMVLRIDVLSARYGPLDGPRWAQALERVAVPVARALRPSSFPWGHIDHPYVGGDPINYLGLGREMSSFYQANVREPMFPATTKVFLVLLGGRDVAVSFASAAASVLAIYATYLLGAAAFSRLVGVLAALWLAIERDVISWSADGWRDDTFMLFVTLATWRLVRLRQAPGRASAIWAGVTAAAACLTRITALTFVLPALAWIVIEAPRVERPSRARAGVLTLAVALLLVAPYLVNCAIQFGDPLYALNYHTRYYRSAERRPLDESVSALDYARDELLHRPVAGLDKAAIGLFVWPFSVKWKGFWDWSPWLERLLPWCSLAGLILWVWWPDGRLLLVILYSSVVAYALTWNVGGGGEWRFTQHAYPIYLLAASSAIVQMWLWLVQALEGQIVWNRQVARRVVATAALVAIIALGRVGLENLPFFVTREALAVGDAATISTGSRDSAYFVSGWSNPQLGEIVNVRASLSEIASVRLPLPGNKDYWLTLRMDPAETEDISMQPRVSVFLNGQPVSQLRLGRDPGRMGLYRLRIPHELARRAFNRLDLVASHTVPAGEAGPKFAWLSANTRVAFRLWYVRLEPVS